MNVGSIPRLVRPTLLVAILCLAATPSAWGQRPPRGERDKPARRLTDQQREDLRERIRQRRETNRDKRATRDDATQAPLDRVLGTNPFRPRRSDQAELEPGEEAALREFMRAHLPERMRRRLEMLGRRHPESFRQRVVPRLRQLRRVFEADENLGQRMLQHMHNNQEMSSAAPRLRARPGDRRRIVEMIRARVAENYRIETEVLSERLETLRHERVERAGDLFDLYLDPDTNLAAEPDEIRRTVRQINAADDDAARDTLRERLWSLAQDRIDREIESAGKSLERRRRQEDEAVQREFDRRIHALERD